MLWQWEFLFLSQSYYPAPWSWRRWHLKATSKGSMKLCLLFFFFLLCFCVDWGKEGMLLASSSSACVGYRTVLWLKIRCIFLTLKFAVFLVPQSLLVITNWPFLKVHLVLGDESPYSAWLSRGFVFLHRTCRQRIPGAANANPHIPLQGGTLARCRNSMWIFRGVAQKLNQA